MQEPNTKSLLDDLGLGDIPEAERNELLADIGEVVFQGAMRKAWNALDLAKQDQLTELLEVSAGAPESDEKRSAVETFLAEYVPDFEAYVAQEVEALKHAQAEAYSELA